MEDTASSHTSADERAAFGDSPTSDALSEGLLSALRPTIERIDASVSETQESQAALNALLESLSDEFAALAANSPDPADLEQHLHRLHSIKRRVAVTSGSLQTIQERLMRIRAYVARHRAQAPAPPISAEGAADGAGQTAATVPSPSDASGGTETAETAKPQQ